MATGFFEAIASDSGPRAFERCLITYVQHHDEIGRDCRPARIINEHEVPQHCTVKYNNYHTLLFHHRQFTVDAVTLSSPNGSNYLTKSNGKNYLTKSQDYRDETQSQGAAACAAPASAKPLEGVSSISGPDALSFSKAAANVAALSNAGAVATQIESAVALMSLPPLTRAPSIGLRGPWLSDRGGPGVKPMAKSRLILLTVVLAGCS